MRLRNINPAGAVYVPMLARTLDAGEVFEVTAPEGAQLLRQPANYESAEGAPLTRPHPRGIPGHWPTPSWWAEHEGWCLLTLRCARCHRVAARYIVPASRQPYGLPDHPVPYAIAAGQWTPAGEIDPERDALAARHQSAWNKLPDPCRCSWDTWPALTDPRVSRRLQEALTGPRPTPATGPSYARPSKWRKSRGRSSGVTLTVPPCVQE